MARRAVTEPSAPPRRGGLRARVRSLPGGRLIWRVGVTAAGVAVIGVGIVLLPLPGPGWLIIFAGLGLLGTEYAWARRLLLWVRDQLRRWTQWVAGRPLWFRLLTGVLSLAFLAALVAAGWWLALGF